MLLQPITNIKTFEEIAKKGATQVQGSENQIPFKNMFEEAIQNVIDTDATLQSEIVKATTGEVDDLHNLNIASTKASLALDTVIQIRNKALDAYNEIMRMGI